MKKGLIVGIVIVIFLILGGIVLLPINLKSKNESKNKCEYENEYECEFEEEDPYFPDVTYEFSGVSEHFIFNVGKVYFSDSESLMYINDFRQVEKIKDLENVSVTVFLNNEAVYTSFNEERVGKLNEKMKGILFYDGYYCKTCQTRKIPLDYTSIDTFKEDMKMELTYCLKDDSCEVEEFTINYN